MKMKVIDITGPLVNGMWTFGQEFPLLNITKKSGRSEGFGEYFYTVIDGLHALSGTYIETPAHSLGYDKSFLINDVPVEKLTNVDCVVLYVEKDISDPSKKIQITLEDLKKCPNSEYICPGDAIIVGCGWDKYWMDDIHFNSCSPYFTYDAMMWLINKKPSILGTDTPSWEDLDDPAGFFPSFYAENILMLAPTANLKAITKPRVKLTVLPIKIENSCAAPCRAVIIED
jgi:arylformamidase